jgi:hypothetical protein
VVVDEFDVPGAAGTPGETEAPLVVDADAVLPDAVAGQLLQTVARGYPQVVDALGGVDENELVIGELAQFRAEFLDVAALPDRLGVLVPERERITRSMITLDVINVKRYQEAGPKYCARLVTGANYSGGRALNTR